MFQIPPVVRIVVALSLLLSLASSGYAAKLLQTYPHDGATSVSLLDDQIALSPDGQYVVAGQKNGKLFVFDAATGSLLHTWQGHFSADSVFGLAINNSPLLITSGTQAQLLNPHTGAIEQTLPCPAGKFTSDGQRVVLTTETTPNLFQVYNTFSGKLVVTVDSGFDTSPTILMKTKSIAKMPWEQSGGDVTFDYLISPNGQCLFPRKNINEWLQAADPARNYAYRKNDSTPECLKIDLAESRQMASWIGPLNLFAAGQFPTGPNQPIYILPPTPPTGLLKPSVIAGNGKVLVFDRQLLSVQSFNTTTELPSYGLALDESGALALIQPDVSVFNLYDVTQTTIVDQLNYKIKCPTLSSYQNRLLFIANGTGYLCDLERTTETQIGGVHLHPLIDADGTFAPGQVLRVVWNLNLQTAGTAAQLELVNIAHPAQSFILTQAWAPFGAATTWVTLPEKLSSGSYVLRARSVWNNALYVDSPPLTIAGNNGAGNWTQYE